MTDNGLAALAEALHHYRGTCELWTISEAACPIDHRVDAAAILPAFLADPRVADAFREAVASVLVVDDAAQKMNREEGFGMFDPAYRVDAFVAAVLAIINPEETER